MTDLTRLRDDLSEQLDGVGSRRLRIEGEMVAVALSLDEPADRRSGCVSRLRSLVGSLTARGSWIESAIGQVDRGDFEHCVLCGGQIESTRRTALCAPCGRDFANAQGRRPCDQHSQLRELIGQTAEALHHLIVHLAPGEAQMPAEAAAAQVLLMDLEQEVSGHFDDEEEQGYMSPAASIAPRLTRQVDALRQEHESFRATFSQIRKRASIAECDRLAWDGVVGQLSRLTAAIMVHERQENALMADAHWEDLGSAD